MKNTRRILGCMLITASLAFTACETGKKDDNSSLLLLLLSGGGKAVINIASIPGVTPPVLGEIPVTSITETAQYTGTVTWDGGWAWSARFGGDKAYMATITLTAKTGYTLTGVTANFFTVAGASSVTNSDDSGVITAVFPATASVGNIGDSALGGKVGYILQSSDTGYVAGEQRGLIAATEDQSTGVEWISGGSTQSTLVPGGTGTALGTGTANTDRIIAQAVAAGNTTPTSYAAGLARAYNAGGYTDWYLPSKDELSKLCTNRVSIGGFASAWYWSSSEAGTAYIAWSQYFGGGTMGGAKFGSWRVRAVRAF
ncbi:MAG: DUF1566 domain-containing protein [Spirochaetes bacterium]|nr:DUF1566 domain-containing protein [Spirochaetota bacterium]